MLNNCSRKNKIRNSGEHILWNGYGYKTLTKDQYDEMASRQSGLCAICNKPETAKIRGNGKRKRLSIDHDHKTGVVRKLLCGKCNTLLGMVNDDPRVLIEALRYLSEHNINPHSENFFYKAISAKIR